MKSALASLLSIMVVFALGEWGSRLWIARFGNALDITRNILLIDRELGWRQRPLLHTEFLHRPLNTNSHGWRGRAEPWSQTPILILGPSSTFGWGVGDDETYSAQLEMRLGEPVINAGEIGYSSAQGVRLFAEPEMTEFRPRLVIIAYGINDIDRHRFYFQSERTDSEQFRRRDFQPAVPLLNMAFSSSMMSVLFDLANGARSWFTRHSQTSQHALRVPLDDFRTNLNQLIHMAQTRGAHVLLLTTVTHYLKATDETARIERDVARYNSALHAVAADTGSSVGELGSWLATKDGDFVDPVHFSTQGNRLIAHGLDAIIRQQGLLQ